MVNRWWWNAKIGQNDQNWPKPPKLAKTGKIGQNNQYWPKLAKTDKVGPNSQNLQKRQKLAKTTKIGQNWPYGQNWSTLAETAPIGQISQNWPNTPDIHVYEEYYLPWLPTRQTCIKVALVHIISAFPWSYNIHHFTKSFSKMGHSPPKKTTYIVGKLSISTFLSTPPTVLACTLFSSWRTIFLSKR